MTAGVGPTDHMTAGVGRRPAPDSGPHSDDPDPVPGDQPMISIACFSVRAIDPIATAAAL